MTDLALMKRITDIRDDLIESAYLPTAVPLPTPRSHVIHATLLGRIAVAAAACIVSCGVLIGVGVPVFQNWVIPALSGTDTETEEVTEPAEDGTQTDQEDNAEKIRLSVEVNPKVVKPGETVEITITIVECHVEIVALFDPILTYGTIPVRQEVLSYEPEHKYVSSSKPFHYTLTIPENAPAGEYDLSVECVGMDTTVTFEKVLTVEHKDGAYVNPYVWITSDVGTVYPFQHVNGGQYIQLYDPDYSERPWGYMYADGLLYFSSYQHDSRDLPTVVLHESLSFHYAETVYSNKTVRVYNVEEKFVTSFHVDEFMTQMPLLPSGIYYCSFNGNYFGADRYEDALNAAKRFDEYYNGGQYEQTSIEEEYQKDPNKFLDREYCEHLIRFIIP